MHRHTLKKKNKKTPLCLQFKQTLSLFLVSENEIQENSKYKFKPASADSIISFNFSTPAFISSVTELILDFRQISLL